MKRHAQAKTFEDVAVWAEPFLTKCESGLECGRVDREQRCKRTTGMQVDDGLGEGFDTPALGTVD